MTHPPLTFGRWMVEIAVRWRLALTVLGGTVAVAAVVVLFLPRVYVARASFITAGTSSALIASALASGGNADALSPQSSGASVAEPATPPGLFVQFIESEALRRQLLSSRFEDPRAGGDRDTATLLEIMRIRADDHGRATEIALARLAKAIAPNVNGESNLVELKVQSQWPELSAAIANRTVTLVREFDQQQRASRTMSRQRFIGSRLDSAAIGLRRAEERGRQFYDANREWQSSPQLVFEESTLRRDEQAATALFLALRKQNEAVGLDVANSAPAITVIDAGVPPGKADWPRYLLLLANALAVGAILAVAAAGVAAVAANRRAGIITTAIAPTSASRPPFGVRSFTVFAWGLAFHSLLITVLFGWFGLPEGTVRSMAAWKEAGLAILVLLVIARAVAGRGEQSQVTWPDLWIGGLITTAVLFLLIENPWLRFNLPRGAEFLGIRDAVYFMLAYFVGRAMPELASGDRAMRSLFLLIFVTCAIGVIERIVVSPEMLVGLGVASYFQNFLGVSAFTVGNDFGLPLNYWTMIGGSLFRRAGSVYLSGQGFAVPFILFFPIATAWVFLRENRSRALIAGYAVICTGLVLTLTRMTILVALVQLVLFVSLVRRPEWAVIGVGIASLVFAIAFVSIPGFPTFVWHTLSWQEGSSISHVTDWTKGLNVLAENPWGSGLGTTDQTAVRAGLKHLTGDNLYLKYGVEMGVLGLGLLVFAFIAIGGSAMKLFRAGITPSQRRIGIAIWLAVIGIAINGLTAVVFNSITLGWLFFWLAGSVVTVAQRLPVAPMLRSSVRSTASMTSFAGISARAP